MTVIGTFIYFFQLAIGIAHHPFWLSFILEFPIIFVIGIPIDHAIVGKLEDIRFDLEFDRETDLLRRRVETKKSELKTRCEDGKLKRNKYSKEISKLREVLDIVDYLESHKHYLLFTEHGYTKAIDSYKKILEKDPNNALALTGMGEAYAMLGNWKEMNKEEAQFFYDESLSASQKAVKINQGLGEAHRALARSLYQTGEFSEAEKEIKIAIRINQSDAEAYHILAVLQKDTKLCKKALKFNHELIIAQRDIGIAYIKQGNLNEAINHFKKVIQLNKDDPYAHSYLGFIYYKQDRHNEALYEYKKAIDIYLSYLQAAINLIKAYETNGMVAEAISETKRAIDNASNEDTRNFLIRRLRSFEGTQLNAENN